MFFSLNPRTLLLPLCVCGCLATTHIAWADTTTPYTALDARGQPTAPAAGKIPHPCVRDNRTGLVWEVKTDDGDLHDQAWTFSWYSSDTTLNKGVPGTSAGGACGTNGRCDTEKYIEDSNIEGLCGFNDWRLPTLDELKTLVPPDVIPDQENPTIDTTYFPNTPPAHYWTSYSSPESRRGVWFISFRNGEAGDCYKDSRNLVRLVRIDAR